MFTCHNQNQTVDFFLHDEIVAIADSFAEFKVTFSWKKTGNETIVGSGVTQGYT